jgi:hypothetical protein
MARHGFGCGEYKYSTYYPLPEMIAGLRPMLDPRLAQVANGCETQHGRLAGSDNRCSAID